MMKEPIKIKKLIKDRRGPIVYSKLRLQFPVVVEIERRSTTGALLYPYIYQIDPEEVRKYPVITRPGGWPGYAVPLRAFKKIARRGELFPPVDRIPASDPALNGWRGYL